MKNSTEVKDISIKRTIDFGLLIFAITTIMWYIGFSYMLGKIDTKYTEEIKILKQNCK